MNYRQKLGYTALGVMATLIGIGVGSIISPPLGAQNNGVFDEIQCNKLTVVDRWARPAIILYAVEHGNGILVNNTADEPTLFLVASEDEHSLIFANTVGNLAVRLMSNKEEGNRISVIDNAGKEAVLLHAGETGNGVFVRDKTGDTAMSLLVNKFLGNKITVSETALNNRWETP